MKCPAPALLLLLVACYTPLIFAQEPVPRPEPIPFGGHGTQAIAGTVTDSSGAVVPGVQVTVTNVMTGATRQVQTDESGQFTVLGLGPGRYRVRVIKPGFSVKEMEVDLEPGKLATLHITLGGGPVPVGDPKEPTPPGEIKTKPKAKSKPGAESAATPSATTSTYVVEVLTITLRNGAAFQSWLNGQTEKHKKLLAIIPLHNTISMFALVPVEGNQMVEYVVESANKPLQPEELKAHIESHPEKVFVGIHRLGHRSFLMVFRHEGK